MIDFYAQTSIFPRISWNPHLFLFFSSCKSTVMGILWCFFMNRSSNASHGSENICISVRGREIYRSQAFSVILWLKKWIVIAFGYVVCRIRRGTDLRLRSHHTWAGLDTWNPDSTWHYCCSHCLNHPSPFAYRSWFWFCGLDGSYLE